MFGKQLSIFTGRRRREYLVTPPPSPTPSPTTNFFSRRFASLPDIPSGVLWGATHAGGSGGRVAWNIRNAKLVEEMLRGTDVGGDGDGGRKWIEEALEERESRGGDEGTGKGGTENGGLGRRGEGGVGAGREHCIRLDGSTEGGARTEKDAENKDRQEGITGETTHHQPLHHLHHQHLLHHHHQELPMRDRSRVGVRSSLPFTTTPHCSSSSGVSSGSSDTQSQGSGGGDSKSDSPTPEGSRKNAESSSSGGVGGVSVRCGKGHELSVPAARASAPSGVRESAALRQEVETLRAEITKARQTILHMQDREKKLKDRLGDRAARGVERGNARVENVNLGERRPTALVRKYGNLYAQARVDTLDALDALPDLKNAEELKSKLLFSVVVLAFRSASSSAQALREEVRRVLQVPPPPPSGEGNDHHHHSYDTQSFALEQAVSSFISTSIEKRDLSKNVEEVCQQIWATLYDYPALKSCEGLLQYVKDCVRLAWGLSNQMPPYVIDYETRTFRKDYHVRFHVADPDSDTIKTYLWPALLEGPGGMCVQKGVVIT